MISPEGKSQVLERWEASNRARFRVERSRYGKEQKELGKGGIQAFCLETLEKGQPLQACPQLFILPSKETMQKLLQRAAKEALKSVPGQTLPN